MDLVEMARKIRPLIEKAAQYLNDQDSSEAPCLFRKMHYDNQLIKTGTKINWNNKVVKAAQDLWDTENNNPDNAPTLWSELNYYLGIRRIPEIITVSLAFSKGEVGWWKDKKFKSLVNSNTYTPEVYPAYWEEIV